MRGSQYKQDRKLVCNQAYKYAQGLSLTGDDKDVWVFDVDETALSNLKLLNESNWVINETSLVDWIEKGEAPALPEALKLYQKLIRLGFKIVFLTGLHEDFTNIRTNNLKAAGYTEWEKLILKGDNDNSSAAKYKSSKREELEKAGYRIRGSIGDQLSDLAGSKLGYRTFKMPNPVYYIG